MKDETKEDLRILAIKIEDYNNLNKNAFILFKEIKELISKIRRELLNGYY